MIDPAAPALLPAGLMDVLPPRAAFEAATVERLVARFTTFGYERIKPPLIEYEETLFAGAGAALATETFRLMDPVSQRMLALRPDMTMQAARIAASRLAHAPRPLRLSYAGQIMRVRGSQLRPERQLGQVGGEIFGVDAIEADGEVIVMATTALAEAGVDRLSVDLGLPTLVPAVLAGRPLDEPSAARIRIALDRKDIAAVRDLAPVIGEPRARLLSRLVACCGPADTALPQLARLDLPEAAASERAALEAVHAGLLDSGARFDDHRRSRRKSRVRIPSRRHLCLVLGLCCGRTRPRRPLSHRKRRSGDGGNPVHGCGDGGARLANAAAPVVPAAPRGLRHGAPSSA